MRVRALTLLAGCYLEIGQELQSAEELRAAVELCRDIQLRSKEDAASVVGLIGVLARADRIPEACELIRRIETASDLVPYYRVQALLKLHTGPTDTSESVIMNEAVEAAFRTAKLAPYPTSQLPSFAEIAVAYQILGNGRAAESLVVYMVGLVASSGNAPLTLEALERIAVAYGGGGQCFSPEIATQLSTLAGEES
jgi:hypothetical protein